MKMRNVRKVAELSLEELKDYPGMIEAMREVMDMYGAKIMQVHGWIQNGEWEKSKILRGILEEPIARLQAELDKKR